MEVMEEGDLMDRVPILLQRDRQYYDVNHYYFNLLLAFSKTDFMLFIVFLAKSNGSTRDYMSWCCWWNIGFPAIRFFCLSQNGRMVR